MRAVDEKQRICLEWPYLVTTKVIILRNALLPTLKIRYTVKRNNTDTTHNYDTIVTRMHILQPIVHNIHYCTTHETTHDLLLIWCASCTILNLRQSTK